MRLTAWLPLAALSALAAAAATHPRYGGTLRVEMRAAPASLDAVEAGPLRSLVYEPLVRLDAAGTPQPWLALSWQHEGNGRRWRFTLRPGVRLHDGAPLTPAALASLPGAVPNGDSVVFRAERGIARLLFDLADRNVVPSGPFRLTAFEAGKHASFAANEDYWGGRPFLDGIEVQLGRAPRDQLADLELGRTDLAELAPADVRRAADHGRTVWMSADIRLIALAAEPGRLPDARLRQALALSLDRAAMHTVLLQKQGDAAAALLPQWISGYALVFSPSPDLSRARALANALPPAARAVTLSFDPAIPAARLLADRVAVNARDAGLTVQVLPPGQPADVRLVERRLHDLDPAAALADLAASFGLHAPSAPGALQAVYESERRLLEDDRVVPLFHLPDLYGAAARVRVYAPPALTRLGDWRFDNLWLAGNTP
ncbi:MAG TPA: ABC transporter substrate-binding protein [Bryobacteraceae bacterium]|nr:ABC transporter substrate-binding protein [Bryobacteraceae bacterium]